ncbi:LysR family transcriptional regulator [Aquincola tertiaricarbonis]|uniref:LysR family transcriptional regulator n=1 Tax=Aquincola tertiaricarbonis TaxID=391953 RepID=A0ABY4RZZ1_AQUTE|nr:LysR family transcriptional regulator [Aquincola tertiaricarbonis]URI06571.1 LysR family transcriptional regulator [Aquincola tertiaricarbonis]
MTLPAPPRRFLPPMSALAALEAAARLQSFTAAAAELHLTQSAVSRQIRALEEQLGAELFVRERQTVRLSPVGELYAQEVRRALQQIATATLAVRANPQGGTLNLAILPTFGTRWLAPRLPGFLAEHPGITINLHTRLAPFDFRNDPLDAAIHFGPPDWPGARLDLLMHETVVAACSPALRRQHRLKRPADLLRAPLVHLASRPDAWERWLQDAQVPFGPLPGMLVDQFALAAQAAVAGLGVALLPRFLIDSELARGDLVLAADHPLTSTDAYHLAWPIDREHHPPLQAFRRWLVAQAAAEA